MATIIADTGPLIALLDQWEAAHGWVREQFGRLREPLLTCDVVLAETVYLLLRRGFSPERFFQLFHRKVIELRFNLQREWLRIENLMTLCHDTPMSLADACLVRMCEQQRAGVIFTLNRDFQIYRKNGDQPIPLLAPFS